MMRYADPLVCPDCRHPIEYGAPACPHCAMPLRGTTAQALFATLMQADRLVEQLRQSVVVPAVVPAAAPPFAASTAAPPPAREPRPSRLEAASVPKILLGLGATCLLVAALVFLAVAWSSMGMGGRTAVLLTLTAMAGGAMAWLAQRTLRAGAESFAVVMLGLVALDLTGAENAGWFGDHRAGVFTLVLGGTLAVAGLATARYGLSSPVERLVAAEVVTGLATGVFGIGLIDLLANDAGALVAVLATVAAAGVARVVRLADVALGLVIVAGVWWLALVMIGLEPIVEQPTAAFVWGDLHGWPLLAAAALAAVPALVPRLQSGLRVAAGGTSLTVLALAATVVVLGNPLDQVALAGLAVLALAVVGMAWLPSPWHWAPIGMLAPAAVATVFFTLLQTGYAASRLGLDPWSASAADHVRADALPLAPWLLVPLVAGLAAALAVGARLIGEALPWHRAAVVLVTLTAAATVASYDVPLWAPVLALAVGVVAAYAVELTPGRSAHGASAALGVVLLAAGLPSDWLTLVALVVLALGALATDLLEDDALVAELALAPLAAATLGTALLIGDVDHDWALLLALAATATVALARPRAAVETGAAVAGVAAVVVQAPDLTWLAVDLTVAGALVMISSLLHRRADLGYVGTALLLGATWARLADVGVTTPEAYTLPLAAVLVAVGLYRMWRSSLGSWPALSPGLGLAVTPTLLAVLADPVSDRAIWLGAGALALVLAGVWLRWSGPLLVGAATGGLEVLREASYASVLPQWVLIALVGSLLTVIGVTWEQRLRDLRLAAGYVRALR